MHGQRNIKKRITQCFGQNYKHICKQISEPSVCWTEIIHFLSFWNYVHYNSANSDFEISIWVTEVPRSLTNKTHSPYCQFLQIHMHCYKQTYDPQLRNLANMQLSFHSICWLPLVRFISKYIFNYLNPLNPELNPICYLLALLGAHHFLHVSRIRVKLLTFRLLMSYIYIWSTHSWCF